jgi:hypothetical protein
MGTIRIASTDLDPTLSRANSTSHRKLRRVAAIGFVSQNSALYRCSIARGAAFERLHGVTALQALPTPLSWRWFG